MSQQIDSSNFFSFYGDTRTEKKSKLLKKEKEKKKPSFAVVFLPKISFPIYTPLDCTIFGQLRLSLIESKMKKSIDRLPFFDIRHIFSLGGHSFSCKKTVRTFEICD